MEKSKRTVLDRFTKCQSGRTLNPFMHVFLFMLLGLSVAFLFFGDTLSVQSVVLYSETIRETSRGIVSAWGLIGLTVIILHTVAFLIQGKIGLNLLRGALFGGFFVWLWAAVIYIQGGFFIQLLVFCFPNLYFWVWYALEWAKRKRGDEVAFV